MNGANGVYQIGRRSKPNNYDSNRPYSGNYMRRKNIGKKGQLGNREQKRYDLRKALGVKM